MPQKPTLALLRRPLLTIEREDHFHILSLVITTEKRTRESDAEAETITEERTGITMMTCITVQVKADDGRSRLTDTLTHRLSEPGETRIHTWTIVHATGDDHDLEDECAIDLVHGRRIALANDGTGIITAQIAHIVTLILVDLRDQPLPPCQAHLLRKDPL